MHDKVQGILQYKKNLSGYDLMIGRLGPQNLKSSCKKWDLCNHPPSLLGRLQVIKSALNVSVLDGSILLKLAAMTF